MDGVGTSESGHGDYVSLAELAAQLEVSVQTIYDLRSKGRGPRGFRVGTQLRFRNSEIDAWVQRITLADVQRYAGETMPFSSGYDCSSATVLSNGHAVLVD